MKKLRWFVRIGAVVAVIVAAPQASAFGLDEINIQSSRGQLLNLLIPLRATASVERAGKSHLQAGIAAAAPKTVEPAVKPLPAGNVAQIPATRAIGYARAVRRFGLWSAFAVLLIVAGREIRLLLRARRPLPQQAPFVTTPAEPAAVVQPVLPRQVQAAAVPPPEEQDSGLTPDFYREVAQLLRIELESSPQRTDLRHKLLEVYSAIGAKEEFREQTRYYLEQLQGRADQYWHDIVCMGRELLPDSSLYTDTPQIMVRTVVQALPAAPARAATFQRFYEAVNHAKLSARQAELERAWESRSRDPSFQKAFEALLSRCMQRPTPLLQAEHLGVEIGGPQVYRKYEDQRGDGDTVAINALGQVLLASSMGKARVVAASVSGRHGEAVAGAAHELGLECVIYMEQRSQNENPERVRRIYDLGASIVTVHPSIVAGSDDVRIRALSDWTQEAETTLYINSVDAGPYPYPSMVLHFQGLVGREARAQMLELTGRPPDVVIASTADGLAAIGMLQPFVADKNVALYCVESTVADDGARAGHGFRREHELLRASGRVSYVGIAAPETAHAIADARKFQNWVVDAAAGEVLAQARQLAKTLEARKMILLILPKPGNASSVVMPLRATG